jgi:hypothetical protein
MSRWIWFVLVIILGIGFGLLYGWALNPVQYVNTSPDSLRVDYKTDVVLMVAEAYQSDGDLTQAARRLAILGDQAPTQMVQQAVIYAGQANYAAPDIDRLVHLSQDLQTWTPVPKIGN